MLRAEIGAALTLLTRVPAGWLAGQGMVEPARAVWAFPLVGAAIGGVGAAVVVAGRWAGMPPAVAAVWAVAAMALLSGGLHEDGLADVADGFGGGSTAARKLEIMRDSRIGSYGALALVLAVAVRVAAIAAVPAGAVIAAAALSRTSLAVPLLVSAPARAGGLGASVVGAGARRWVCLALGAVVAGIVLPPGQALAGVGAAMLGAGAVAWLARRQIGGFTGDVLGAGALVAECAGLSAMACVT